MKQDMKDTDSWITACLPATSLRISHLCWLHITLIIDLPKEDTEGEEKRREEREHLKRARECDLQTKKPELPGKPDRQPCNAMVLHDSTVIYSTKWNDLNQAVINEAYCYIYSI